jgi:hypothetical protein
LGKERRTGQETSIVAKELTPIGGVFMSPNKIDDLIRSGEIMSADTIAMLKLAQLKAPKVFRP